MDLREIANSLGAGAGLLLLLAVVGALRGDWVPGYQHKALQKERDEWKALALKGNALTRDAIEVAKK
jgi:hypothetical protein